MIESDNEEETFREVPLGEGSVKFPEYLRALESIGYKGFLTIEREVGENPEMDIRMSVKFLNNVINNLKKV
jgi:sugar phosphate isomerase/epimerase